MDKWKQLEENKMMNIKEAAFFTIYMLNQICKA